MLAIVMISIISINTINTHSDSHIDIDRVIVIIMINEHKY